MHIHCFLHVAFETPGTILEWAGLNGYTITYTRFQEESYSLPAHSAIDALLIMGGPMNVDETDTYPWLIPEKDFIRAAIEKGKKVMGICLGAQLIAGALGQKVYKGKEKEIGFLPITFTEEALQLPFCSHYPREYTLFHWHGDTFDLPDNAILLASTEACVNQAFLIGHHVLGLQFHPEMNETTIEQMLLHDGGELEEKGPFIQSKEMIRRQYPFLENNRKDLFRLLEAFFMLPPAGV